MAILIVFCLFAPLPLWLIETLLPFPYLIEEIFKFFIVKKTPSKTNYLYPLILGIVFSISETMLYLTNFFLLGNFTNLINRLIFTTILHTLTFTLQYFAKNNHYLSIIMLIVSILIHYFYNLSVR